MKTKQHEFTILTKAAKDNHCTFVEVHQRQARFKPKKTLKIGGKQIKTLVITDANNAGYVIFEDNSQQEIYMLTEFTLII
jgi:hypothetical protein